jgi:hypothetical protein
MNDLSQNQFVVMMARDLVSELAPQEIPLFRANSEAYFKDPQKMLEGKTGKDEMLGFGTGEAISLLTPVILSVSVEVVKFVTEEVKKSLKTESASVINDVVKSMFKKYRPPEAPAGQPASPALTAQQLQEIHKLTLLKARQLNLQESQARQLADALVSGLVVPG